jgi:HD superfamily phosphohydrolase
MFDIPELRPTSSSLRISPEVDVPVTARVKRIIDTAAFRRLSRVSQLGLVSMVYPGACHTRFEHSLGVFRNAIHYVQQLQNDPIFCEYIDEESVLCFMLAALLHDIGHWPFCHAIEDLRLEGLPRHELLARSLLSSGELADAIRSDWGLDPEKIANIIAPAKGETEFSPTQKILKSMLSGPIDIDKLDYLERDSLHAGVPYGRNFDRNRLVRSLCIQPETFELAITDKGKTAAEMMVFARYVMFSEVYWHHAVRSATAMLHRAVHRLRGYWNQEGADVPGLTRNWIHLTDSQWTDQILEASRDQPWFPCVDGLFGMKRKLFKRVLQIDCLSNPELHRKLARRPYIDTVTISERLATLLTGRLQRDVSSLDVLVDAPPIKLEVQFRIEVKQHGGQFRSLGELSPMVQSLATKQFDDIVKRVRVFVSPEVATAVNNQSVDVVELITAALE